MAIRKVKSAGSPEAGTLLRSIPQVDKLLGLAEFEALVASHSRPLVVRQVRDDLARLRQRAVDGDLQSGDVKTAAIRERVAEALARQAIPYYRRVINATGVVLHTGLGRAPLAPEAVRALRDHAGHPVRVEIDLESGERGGRDEGCAAMLRELTGAQAATVVNNNAGATLLMLAAVARGKKVVISRGELVEIGGSYRIPEIMKESGAILVEVGTTNRTHPRDYRDAIDADTGMILKVHTSNYRIEGFSSEVEIEELVAMGEERGIPVVHDLGSGCLIDLERYGLSGEPHVLRSVAAGADLISFSGDKLLGGPQSGIIIGKKTEVDRCRNHPLFRALRPGRLSYVALEATLRIYLRGESEVLAKIPAMGRLLAEPSELRARARRLARRLENLGPWKIDVVAENSQAGSGSLPARDLPTSAVRVTPVAGGDENGRAAGGRGAGADGAGDAAAAATAAHGALALARDLRTGEPAILARVRDDAVLLDPRTIENAEFALIEARFRALAAAANGAATAPDTPGGHRGAKKS